MSLFSFPGITPPPNFNFQYQPSIDKQLSTPTGHLSMRQPNLLPQKKQLIPTLDSPAYRKLPKSADAPAAGFAGKRAGGTRLWLAPHSQCRRYSLCGGGDRSGAIACRRYAIMGREVAKSFCADVAGWHNIFAYLRHAYPPLNKKRLDLIKPFSVGVPRFELGTPCSQSRCANRTALHPEKLQKRFLPLIN